MAKTVVGIFRSVDHARMAVEELQKSGFDRGNISLVTRDTRAGEQARRETGIEDVKEGAAAGAGLGAVLGGAAGLLVGLGALAIPGIGPVVAAGPLAAALGGAGLGAAAGGITGALVDMGVPENDAEQYSEGIRRGGTLVSVRAEDHRAHEAANIMERHEPLDIRHGADAWRDLESAGRGGQPMAGMEPDFDLLEPQFRQHYRASLARSGRSFEDYRHAYRYGYRLHQDLRCNGACNWEEVWPDARRDWERRYPDTDWHEVEDAVRHAFEQPYH